METVEEEEKKKSAHTGNRTLIYPSSNISMTVIQLSQLITSFVIFIATGNEGLIKYIYSLCARLFLCCNIPFIISSISLFDFLFLLSFFCFGPYCEPDEYTHIIIYETLCVIY